MDISKYPEESTNKTEHLSQKNVHNENLSYSPYNKTDDIPIEQLPKIVNQPDIEFPKKSHQEPVINNLMKNISIIMLILSAVLIVIAIIAFFSSAFAGAIFLLFSIASILISKEYSKEFNKSNSNYEAPDIYEAYEKLKSASNTLNPDNISSDASKDDIIREIDSMLEIIKSMEKNKNNTENDLQHYKNLFLKYRSFILANWLY